MVTPTYQNPGEVREAKNFQCCHCSKICSTPQGLCGHLHRLHKIRTQDIQYKRDWETTDQVANDNEPSPAINRNISISGDRKMKSSKEREFNLKCLVCKKPDYICSSSAGMSTHQDRRHDQGSKQGENWEWTTEPVVSQSLLY